MYLFELLKTIKDAWCFSGIYRDAFLSRKPGIASIFDMKVLTNVLQSDLPAPGNMAGATVTATVKLKGRVNGCTVVANLLDCDGHSVQSARLACHAEEPTSINDETGAEEHHIMFKNYHLFIYNVSFSFPHYI